jgi:hypothetical protein
MDSHLFSQPSRGRHRRKLDNDRKNKYKEVFSKDFLNSEKSVVETTDNLKRIFHNDNFVKNAVENHQNTQRND